MPIAEAHVQTERASRYLVRLCRHINSISEISNEGAGRRHGPRAHPGGGASRQPGGQLRVEWSDTRGVVSSNSGRCVLQASPAMLTLRAEADSDENLQMIQEMVTERLARLSWRDPLAVTWQPAGTAAAQPGEAASR